MTGYKQKNEPGGRAGNHQKACAFRVCSSQDIKRHLTRAFHYRESLALNTNAMRLVNSQGDGLKGLIIDRFNKHFVVYMLDARWQRYQKTILEILCEHFEVLYLVFKEHSARDASRIAIEVLIDKEDSKTIIEENGLLFHVDLNDHLHQGLFMDMRRNRSLVASCSRGRAVLNCFAYTCSFGMYGRKSGASRVINVDISSKFLQKGKENYRLNRLPEARGEFVREDVIRYLERTAKRNNCFDIVILDPPSFSRFEAKVFSVKKDMPVLIEKAFRVLGREGMLFVSTNLSSIPHAKLEEWACGAAGKSERKILEVKRLSQDVDFRGSGLMKESFLSAVLIKTGVS